MAGKSQVRVTQARSAVLAGVIVAVAALGVSASHASGGSPTAPAGLSPGVEIIESVNARARDQWIARQNRLRFLATPEQRQARQASSTAFRDLGRDAAARLARQTFGDVMTRPSVGPLRSGQRADEYVGDFAARLHGAAPDGTDAFVVSGQPLRVKDAAGKLAPVDITLQRGAAGWAPKNPMEQYVLGESSSEGLSFSDAGVSVTPQGAAVPGTLEGETVLYAQTNTDTDTFVKPLSDGAEFLWQLRSADSPEELLLSVDLPPRAKLSMRGDGSVALVRDGKTIGAISAPVAVDANQEPVDTSMRVADSDTVAVAVQHRKANPAYPILVDPVVRAGFYFQTQGSSWYGYWGTTSTGRSTSGGAKAIGATA